MTRAEFGNWGRTRRRAGTCTVEHTQEDDHRAAQVHTGPVHTGPVHAMPVHTGRVRPVRAHQQVPAHQHWLSRNRLLAAMGALTVYATALAVDTGHADRTWAIWAAVGYGVTTLILWFTRHTRVPVLVPLLVSLAGALAHRGRAAVGEVRPRWRCAGRTRPRCDSRHRPPPAR